MEVSDPSGSIYGQIAGMEPRRFNVTPGRGRSVSGGNGGRSRSVCNSSSRRRSRMSDPHAGTSLMPQFNAAAADGGDSGSSSPQRLDLVLDEWRRRNIGNISIPEALPTPRQVPHLLFLGTPMRAVAADDDVIIMDGVLVGNSSRSRITPSTRRSFSFSEPGLVATVSPGSIGGSSCGFNCRETGSSSSSPSGGGGGGSSTILLAGLLGFSSGNRFSSNGEFPQVAQARKEFHRMQDMSARFSSPAQEKEESHMMQAMKARISEMMASPNSGRPSDGSPNMLESPNRLLLPRSPPEPAFPVVAPRAVSSYTDTAVTIRPPASYFTAAGPSLLSPTQPGTEPVKQAAAAAAETSFSWPPTAEEDAAITQQLYGPTTGVRRRLPVFEDICPEK